MRIKPVAKEINHSTVYIYSGLDLIHIFSDRLCSNSARFFFCLFCDDNNNSGMVNDEASESACFFSTGLLERTDAPSTVFLHVFVW